MREKGGCRLQVKGFVRNAAILTVTALVLRSLGMVFRIYLSGRLGEQGMGLYQLIVSSMRCCRPLPPAASAPP
jgi:O-antigen/teichoic acid export membrane protein